MADNKPLPQKSILIFVIVLFALIASLSVASYLASVKNIPPVVVQPTEEPTINYDNETKNWKIYSNNEYWFQIKYPIDWHFNGSQGGFYSSNSLAHYIFTSNNGNNDIRLEVFTKDADISKYREMVKTEEAFIKTNYEKNIVFWFVNGLEIGSEKRLNLEMILRQMASTFKLIEIDDIEVIAKCKEKTTSREVNSCFISLGKEKNINFCDKVDTQGQAYCYAGVGAVKKDVSVCDNLSGKNFCLGLTGGLINDQSVCEGIKDPSCVRGLSITLSKIDDSFCEKVIDKDLCYIEKALKDKDSKICKNKVEVSGAKEDCFRELAIFLLDADICDNILQGPCRQFYWAGRDYCYNNVAVQSSNPEICGKAICGWDSYCYADVAKKLNDINICKMTSLEGEMTWPSVNCFTDLAVSVNDVETCKSLIDNSTKDFCYFGIAQKFKDVSICDNVQEVEAKESCYKNIDK